MNLLATVSRWRQHEHACGKAFVAEADQGPASPALRCELVRFDDGAYTKWHYHTGEQMLLVADGEGFVDYQDRASLTLRDGAKVFIPAGVWHRHGAVAKSPFLHLAVTYGATCWANEDPCVRYDSQIEQMGLSIESEIAYLNQRILQAEESGQVADFSALLADAFVIVRSTGEHADRRGFLAAVPTNANRGRSASDMHVHLVGECAVFTCVVQTTKKPDGAPDITRFWNTRLFIRENGQWRCAQWQVVRIPETLT